MEILNWFNLGFCNDVGLVHFLLRFYSLGSIARSTAILARIEEASSATFLGIAKSQVHAPSWFIFHVLKFGCALSILKLIRLPWIIASLTARYLNLFSTISVGAASLTASCLNHFSTFSVGANIGSKNIFFGLSSRCHKSNSILPFSLSFTRLPLLCFFCFGSLATTIFCLSWLGSLSMLLCTCQQKILISKFLNRGIYCLYEESNFYETVGSTGVMKVWNCPNIIMASFFVEASLSNCSSQLDIQEFS